MNKILDLSKPDKEVLIDKFNAISGMKIPYEFVEIESITPLANPTSKEDTKVTFVPTAIAIFLNKFSLTYKRMDLSDIFSKPYINVPSDGYTLLYELLDNINATVGINLKASDVHPATVDETNPLYKTVFIKTKDTSPLYKGEFTLPLDTNINPQTNTSSSNTFIFTLVKNNNSNDTIECLSSDGYLTKTFSFLKNVSSIQECKIDDIFNLDSTPIVVTGSFQLVEPNISFIDPAITYKTITIDKAGNLLSTKEQITPLALVDKNNITKDIVNKFYYIVDKNKTININNKHIYRLFENGTIDSNFVHASLPDNIVNIVCCDNGFFTIEKQASSFSLKKFTLNSTLDTNFSEVLFTKADLSNISFNGFVEYGLNNEEIIKLLVKQDLYDHANAIQVQTTNVQSYISQDLNEFFSPIVVIKDSGLTAQLSTEHTVVNNKNIFNNNKFFNKLLKDVNRLCAVYALDNLSYLKSPTLVTLSFDEEKRYLPKLIEFTELQQVVEILDIKQNASGYETYCLARVQNQPQTVILNFDKDHNLLGYSALSQSQDVFIKDFLIAYR